MHKYFISHRFALTCLSPAFEITLEVCIVSMRRLVQSGIENVFHFSETDATSF